MKRAFFFFILITLLCNVPFSFAEEKQWIVLEEETAPSAPNPRHQARVLMRHMTDDEKIGQLLIVSPEDLTGGDIAFRIENDDAFSALPVGGVILYGQNIASENQLHALIGDIQEKSQKAGLYPPFIAVDEEGGYVARIARKLNFSTASAADVIGATGDAKNAYEAGKMIGTYLKAYGINLDLAPVADVMITESPEIMERSFGSDASLVSDMAWQMAEGLREQGIIPCYKHFPGHGTVQNNAHNTPVSHSRTLAEMKAAELIPFQYAIDHDIEMIMLSHLRAREIDDEWPVSMSNKVVTGLLRDEMGYDGVVITDAIRMDAIREKYAISTTVTRSLQSGANMILAPGNGQEAFHAIKRAIQNGALTWDRIDESVERIIALKIESGLIQ